MFAIFKRELFSLFVTPLAWVTLTAFNLIQGFSFYLVLSHFAATQDMAVGGGPLQVFLGGTPLAYLPLMFLCPLLTMRLLADERRTGTIETLLTAPVTPLSVVLAKYGAAVVTYMAMWLPTLSYVFILSRSGEVDWRVVGCGYAGLMLIGAGYLAIGVATSALSKSQLTAAVISGITILSIFVLGVGENIFDQGSMRFISEHVSVSSFLGEFSRGLIHSKRLVFAATLIVVPLFFAVRTVESWRWG